MGEGNEIDQVQLCARVRPSRGSRLEPKMNKPNEPREVDECGNWKLCVFTRRRCFQSVSYWPLIARRPNGAVFGPRSPPHFESFCLFVCFFLKFRNRTLRSAFLVSKRSPLGARLFYAFGLNGDRKLGNSTAERDAPIGGRRRRRAKQKTSAPLLRQRHPAERISITKTRSHVWNADRPEPTIDSAYSAFLSHPSSTEFYRVLPSFAPFNPCYWVFT